MDKKTKKILLVSITIIVLIGFFIVAKNINPESLKTLGGSLPLPLFTFLIALVDGFNPCNLFILSLLVSLMLSESHSRKRILAVGYTFIMVVYIFYFLFMIAWLNIFQYIGFIDPLRIGIAVLAIMAGLINCKELFFYRKGITLMVQDKNVGPLKKRIRHVAELIKKGKMGTLIVASIVLAVFSSLVELPCTAGFPVVYTAVLSSHSLAGFFHYLYLLFYNAIYVLPLIIIVTILGYTFKGKPVSKNVMATIKFIGGGIMLLLGIILLVNPSLIVGA